MKYHVYHPHYAFITVIINYYANSVVHVTPIGLLRFFSFSFCIPWYYRVQTMRNWWGSIFSGWHPFYGGSLDLPEQYTNQLMSDFHNIRVVLYVLKHSEFISYICKVAKILFSDFLLGSFLTWDPPDRPTLRCTYLSTRYIPHSADDDDLMSWVLCLNLTLTS